MKSAIIKKARRDEQQNQTTATNISYIRNFTSIFLKKYIINKVKIESDKTESEQNNLYLSRKIQDQSKIGLG